MSSLPVLAVLVAAVVLGASNPAARASDAEVASSFEYVTVQAGETLWGIAEEVAPAADPRDVITDLVNLNQLRSAEVQPGQRLAIPASF